MHEEPRTKLEAVRGGKKRNRSTKEDDEQQHHTDDTTTASSSSDEEEEQPVGISTLLTAAARLETKKAKKEAKKAKTASTTVISRQQNREAPPPLVPGICTLLEVATTMADPRKASATTTTTSTPASSSSSSSTSKPPETKAAEELRPPKPMAIEESMLYPTEQELEISNTRRSRKALHSWYDRLRDLHAYKKEHGDCMVPQKYPSNHALGIWVNKQRMEKRLKDQGAKSTMTDRRLILLDAVGFHWAKHKGQVSWDQKYNELRDFHRENGHCNVPTKYRENSALGRWISTQRAQLKEWKRGEKTSMTQERYEKLCALDFQFERLATKKREDDDEEEEEDDTTGSSATAERVVAAPPVVPSRC